MNVVILFPRMYFPLIWLILRLFDMAICVLRWLIDPHWNWMKSWITFSHKMPRLRNTMTLAQFWPLKWCIVSIPVFYNIAQNGMNMRTPLAYNVAQNGMNMHTPLAYNVAQNGLYMRIPVPYNLAQNGMFMCIPVSYNIAQYGMNIHTTLAYNIAQYSMNMHTPLA